MPEAPALYVPGPRDRNVRALGAALPLARRLPTPVTFVMSGGGSHGAVQWGSLQALSETDIRPDSIIGTSAGALSGSVYAEDPVCGLNRLSYVWAQMNERYLVGDGSLTRKLISNARSSALFDNDAELQTLESIYHARSFEELALPFAAVATNIATGRAKVFDSGALLPALLATSAIPGMLPPVRIDERWYCDGLASANVPAIPALERGAGSLIVLDTGDRDWGSVSSAPTKVATRVAATLRDHSRNRQLKEAAKEVPVLVLPTPVDLGATMDFSESSRAGAHSYSMARQYLTEMALSGSSELPPGLYRGAKS